jgi:hypothetical protein
MEDNAPAILIPETTLSEVKAKLTEALAACESARAFIAEIAGPAPSQVPAFLLARVAMGTGYLREARDTLSRLTLEAGKQTNQNK